MTETSLHAALKDWYAHPTGQQEVWIDGYWIDAQVGEQLIEIQTRNFAALRPKLAILLDQHPVRLVHPVAVETWIVRLPARPDEPPTRRKSPRRGRVEDVFQELTGLPDLLAHPNFSLEIALVRQEEIRRADGRGSWRRGGVSIIDRRLVELVERRLYAVPADLRAFLPPDLAQPFTQPELAARLALRPRLAGKMCYCLRRLGVIAQTGKRGRAYLYQINPGGAAYGP